MRLIDPNDLGEITKPFAFLDDAELTQAWSTKEGQEIVDPADSLSHAYCH